MIVLGPVRRHQWDERERLMPSLLRFLTIVVDTGRGHLRRRLFAGAFRSAETAGNHRLGPARPILQEPLRPWSWFGGRLQKRRGRQNLPTQRLVSLFLDMLAAERGAGKNTLDAYGRDLADFTSYLGGAGGSVASAATDDLRGLSRATSPSAVCGRRRWRGASPRSDSFIASSTRKAGAKTTPPPYSKAQSATRPLPKTLTLAEVDRLLRVAGQTDPAAPLSARLRAARLACLVELLYATGLRVSELVALPASAARRDARVIVVRGKGNKERLVPLNNAAKRATAEYLALATEARGKDGMAPDRNGYSRRSAIPGISPASILPAISRRSPPPPDCGRRS